MNIALESREDGREDAEDPEGPRDSDSHQRRIHAESRESGKAKISAQPTEEEVRKTANAVRGADCTAKHTRLNRSSDV